MATRSMSRGKDPASAWRACTWSSSAYSASRRETDFSHAGERPGVPRPSATITANPWSANHCEVRWA